MHRDVIMFVKSAKRIPVKHSAIFRKLTSYDWLQQQRRVCLPVAESVPTCIKVNSVLTTVSHVVDIMASTSKWRELTLRLKVEVMSTYVKANACVGAGRVAEVFECGKISILLRHFPFIWIKRVTCFSYKSGSCSDEFSDTAFHVHFSELRVWGFQRLEDLWLQTTKCKEHKWDWVFCTTLPNTTLAVTKKECRWKNVRGEVNHCILQEKKPPVVIGKSASPCCFNGLRTNPHGLPYHFNLKA